MRVASQPDHRRNFHSGSACDARLSSARHAGICAAGNSDDRAFAKRDGFLGNDTSTDCLGHPQHRTYGSDYGSVAQVRRNRLSKRNSAMSAASDAPAAVFVDADNTLWDTDQVYAAAQLTMLAQTETALGKKSTAEDRLAFVRASDQAIAARHYLGLRYPPRLLVRALAYALCGMPSDIAAKAARLGADPSPLASEAEAEIEQGFSAMLKKTPALRPGVIEGLKMLERAGTTTLIVSESSRAKVEATAATLGLKGHFTRVIEGQKRPELYRRILRLIGNPEHAFIIGDQLDRDIGPAKEAGLITIYFPGGFAPRWTPEEAKVGPDFRVSSFVEAASIIVAGRSRNAARPGA